MTSFWYGASVWRMATVAEKPSLWASTTCVSTARLPQSPPHVAHSNTTLNLATISAASESTPTTMASWSPTVKRLSNNSDGVPTSLLLTG